MEAETAVATAEEPVAEPVSAADEAGEQPPASDASTEERTLGGPLTSSPLLRIREKEVEISGRMLEVRAEAERIVAEARRTATDVVLEAREAADRQADERIAEVLRNADAEAARARAEIDDRIKELASRLESRKEEAVKLVFGMVTES